MNAAGNRYPVRQRGMALVVVLWIIVLLSVMAASHARNVHVTTRLTARQVAVAELRAAANAGVQRAIIELLAQDQPVPWPVNGEPQTIDFAGSDVSIAIRSASGLVDINAATPQLIASLVEVIGADASVKSALADAILDWRDEDDLSHLHGAENTDYQQQQSDWSIRNGAFVAVDELRYVAGMTNQYFQAIAPLATVDSGYAGVNIEYAAPELLQLLVGESINAEVDYLPAPSQPAVAPAAARAGTYHINVEATSTTAVAAVAAVVRITPGEKRPYTVLSWREPGRVFTSAAQ